MAEPRSEDGPVWASPAVGRLDECTAYYYPHAFINKANEPIVIKGLDAKWHEPLNEMYLAFTPKRSFGGLPPADPDECTRWVRRMIVGGGVSLVAMAFDQGVVGHAALFAGADRTCEVLVVVSPPNQNVGIGTELVRCSIHLSHALGFERIWASIERKNRRCRHVLKKCGFGCETPDQSDEVMMGLNLREYHDPTKVQVREIMNREVLTVHRDWPCRVGKKQGPAPAFRPAAEPVSSDGVPVSTGGVHDRRPRSHDRGRAADIQRASGTTPPLIPRAAVSLHPLLCKRHPSVHPDSRRVIPIRTWDRREVSKIPKG